MLINHNLPVASQFACPPACLLHVACSPAPSGFQLTEVMSLMSIASSEIAGMSEALDAEFEIER